MGSNGEVVMGVVRNDSFQPIAVKKLAFITPGKGADADVIRKIKKELDILKKLQGPHIVKYLGCDIIQDEGNIKKFCIYLEYMSEGSIQTVY